MPDIDVAGATAALESQGGMPTTMPTQGTQYQPETPTLPRNADGTFAPRASDATPPADANAQPAPEPAATPQGTDDAPAFTHIDDSALTPELLQLKRSLQADYTRKTQEAAPWRKLGEELGVTEPSQFRDALEVYTRLQDPRNWPTIHQELSNYMQQYGMTPQEANAAAADQLANMAPAQDLDEVYNVDPDVAPVVQPLMQQLQQQQQQIQQLYQSIQQDQQRREQEAQWQAVAENLTRQETHIRAQNPHYGDDEIEAIYNLVGNDGNLIAAQQRYESIIGQRVAQYIQSKAGTQAATPSPPSGPGLPAQTQDAPVGTPHDRFEQSHRAAMAHIAALERA